MTVAANALLDRGWGKPIAPVAPWVLDPPTKIELNFGFKPKEPPQELVEEPPKPKPSIWIGAPALPAPEVPST